jgi:hypothetical protein
MKRFLVVIGLLFKFAVRLSREGILKTFELDSELFKVDSSSWDLLTVDGRNVPKVLLKEEGTTFVTIRMNKERDIIELSSGFKDEYLNKQIFQWSAMYRETRKAGKEVPSALEMYSLVAPLEMKPLPVVVYVKNEDINFRYNTSCMDLFLWTITEERNYPNWRPSFKSVFVQNWKKYPRKEIQWEPAACFLSVICFR